MFRVVSGDLSEMVPYLGGDKIRVLAVFSEIVCRASLPISLPLRNWGYDFGGGRYSRSFYVGPKVSDADYQWWVVLQRSFQQTRRV